MKVIKTNDQVSPHLRNQPMGFLKKWVKWPVKSQYLVNSFWRESHRLTGKNVVALLNAFSICCERKLYFSQKMNVKSMQKKLQKIQFIPNYAEHMSY